jgi:hypothetical protein
METREGFQAGEEGDDVGEGNRRKGTRIVNKGRVQKKENQRTLLLPPTPLLDHTFALLNGRERLRSTLVDDDASLAFRCDGFGEGEGAGESDEGKKVKELHGVRGG